MRGDVSGSVEPGGGVERGGGVGSRAWRTVLARAGVCAISAAVALAIADWAVDRWAAVPALIFELDPVLLHELVPNSRRVLSIRRDTGRERVVVEINSRGFRGPELETSRARPRWIVYGDSLVLAENVRWEETFVCELARVLSSDRATQIEVVNAGVTGYGPDQVCLRIEREALELDPDGIVLVVCAHNDLGDLVRDKIFGLDGSGGLLVQPYELDPALVEGFAEKRRLARRPALLRWLASLAEAGRPSTRFDPGEARETEPFMQWYLAAAREEYTEYVIAHDLRVRTLFEDYYDADVALAPDSESAQYKVRLFAEVVGRIRAVCAARGIALFAVVVPSAVDLCGEFEIRVDPAAHPAYRPSRLTDALAAALAARDVAFLDLFELFARSEPCRLYGGRQDFHWNARGQELAARATAQALRALGAKRDRDRAR